MPGRIRDADIALVRERAPIAEVVGAAITLRPAGGGRLKGLCPFHEEKTPSFSVNPQLGVYHCFGCGESGDVITFLRKTEALTFSEAVERLALRAGVTLTYEQGGAAPSRVSGQRQRLLDAHRAAEQFYAEGLRASGAGPQLGRDFLLARGFEEPSWERFGVGYAPDGWDTLTRHLLGRGYRAAELVTAGLSREGQRGPADRFRSRLVWPIRDRVGDTIGFGARRLSDDDSGPKYLNTPETPLYHKSSVLYGLDLARKEIAQRHQAVVVEGYTDVMACHLAGVPTAVATCGTAFGSEHVATLRLMLMDQDELRGEVIFTFDGDAAGQKAALRTFTEDQRFVTQTFVAVGPDGMDPCELRLARGDAAVRDLVASRVPLFAFVLRSTLDRYDLDTPEGRVQALAACVPVVASIRDRALRPEYARRLAGWLGMEVDTVVARVAEAVKGAAKAKATNPAGTKDTGRSSHAVGANRPASAASGGGSPTNGSSGVPEQAGDPLVLSVEREVLKAAIQRPGLAGAVFDSLAPEAFTGAGYRAVRQVLVAAGGSAAAGRDGDAGRRLARLRELAPNDAVRNLLTELAVEPLHVEGEPDERYVDAVLARVQEFAVTRELAELKSRLERTNPVQAPADHDRLFAELVALEAHKRSLRTRALGES